jgi:hypothetical protein
MNSIQQLAVDNLKKQRRNAREKGFYHAVLEAMCGARIEGAARKKRILNLRQRHIPRPQFLPDLYEINSDERQIIIYEIEDTHPISPEKLDLIRHWMWGIDCYTPWDLLIFVTDRYGLNLRRVYRFHAELDDDYEPLDEHIRLHNATHGHLSQPNNDERCFRANLYLKWFLRQERKLKKEYGVKDLTPVQRASLLEEWKKMALNAPENEGLQLVLESLQEDVS